MDTRTSTQADASQSRLAIGFPRSLSFRLALLYGLIFAASSALLIGITEITTIASLTEQRDDAISAELRELVLELKNENGIDEVRQEIGERDSAPNKSQFVYSLSDKDGHVVAGTRLNVPRRDGWSDVNSWYKNEHGRVTQNWPFTLLEYWQRTRAPDPDDYVLS